MFSLCTWSIVISVIKNSLFSRIWSALSFYHLFHLFLQSFHCRWVSPTCIKNVMLTVFNNLLCNRLQLHSEEKWSRSINLHDLTLHFICYAVDDMFWPTFHFTYYASIYLIISRRKFGFYLVTRSVLKEVDSALCWCRSVQLEIRWWWTFRFAALFGWLKKKPQIID